MADASKQPPAAPKPQRTPDEIARDITAERAAMVGVFDQLRDELDEAVDAANAKAKEIGRKAMVVGPAVAGVAGALTAGLMMMRRRSRRRRER